MDSKFTVFNKSSVDMSGISDKSIDLIVTSPPYNIGTRYGNNTDKLNLGDFQNVLRKVVSNCSRILRDDGILVIEAADTIVTGGTYMQLAGYIQSLAIDAGLKVIDRHINFALSKNGEELPEHNWEKDYTAMDNAHSNCHQIVVLSKSAPAAFDTDGKILYVNYSSSLDHPCPTPLGIYSFILDTYFRPGMTVADPFMGTALLGKEVLRRGGSFIGYELDEKIFKVAKNNLES